VRGTPPPRGTLGKPRGTTQGTRGVEWSLRHGSFGPLPLFTVSCPRIVSDLIRLPPAQSRSQTGDDRRRKINREGCDFQSHRIGLVLDAALAAGGEHNETHSTHLSAGNVFHHSHNFQRRAPLRGRILRASIPEDPVSLSSPRTLPAARFRGNARSRWTHSPQRLKPRLVAQTDGTTEVVPFPSVTHWGHDSGRSANPRRDIRVVSPPNGCFAEIPPTVRLRSLTGDRDSRAGRRR